MHEPWAQWEGQVVEGKFPLRQYLGGSRRSAVFLTEYDRPEPRNAAIKLVPADSADTELQLFRWRLGAELSHPHLIRIFETGRAQLSDGEWFYVVMEYAEENLSDVLRHRALTAAEARDMLDPTADALAYLHGKGLVHGHVKPANIMAVNDQLKVSSDGLYKAGERAGAEESSAYDPPEIAEGVSPAGDVWSLGMTLVEALTQRAPVPKPPEPETLVLPNSISRPLVDIARHCLKRDHWLRWTAADVIARLRKISEEGLGEATRATVPISKRHYVALAAVLSIVLAAIVIPRMISQRQNELGSLPVPLEQPSPKPESPRKPTTPGVDQSKTGASEKRSLPGSSLSPTPQQVEPKSAPNGSYPGEVLAQALPDVPAKIRNGINGTVRVRVRAHVDPSGRVVGTRLDSAGPSKYFAAKALQAARLWKFKPPRVNGRDASSEWVLRFAFARSRTVVTPLQAAP